MRMFKLLKDTPTIKAGAIFRSPDIPCDRLFKDSSTEIAFRRRGINDFDEWFVEVKEFEEWKPKEDEVYKRVGLAGDVYVEVFSADDRVHEFRLSIGGLYPLDTPDEVIIKEQKLIPQAMHRLRMAAKKAWFEFNGSEGPDWNNRLQEKWKLSYDHSTDIFLSTVNRIEQFGNLPCFPTEESCQAYIDNNLDDLKLVFGVE